MASDSPIARKVSEAEGGPVNSFGRLSGPWDWTPMTWRTTWRAQWPTPLSRSADRKSRRSSSLASARRVYAKSPATELSPVAAEAPSLSLCCSSGCLRFASFSDRTPPPVPSCQLSFRAVGRPRDSRSSPRLPFYRISFRSARR